MSRGSVEILLGLNIKNFNRNLEQASARLQQTGDRLQSIGGNMSKFVTVPLVAAGGAAVKMSMDFEDSMNKIVGLVGVGRDEVDGWREDIMKMSRDTGRSANELGDAMFFITSAGLRGSEALDALETSARASAVGLGETKTVADLVTSAMNAYGADTLNAASATDVLTAAVREGKAEAPELAQSMGQVLPIASEMGVQFDQVGAAIAAMTRTGTNAGTASMQLRQILSSLLSPTKQAEDALSEMGLSASGLRTQIREDGLISVLQTLKGEFDNNDEAAAQVFGNVRALSGVLDIMGSNAEENIGIFERMTDTSGALDEAFEKTESTSRELNRLWAATQEILIEVGDVISTFLVPAIQNLTGFVGGLTDRFRGMSEGTQRMSIIIAGVAAAIGPVLLAVGTMIKLFGLALVAINPVTLAIAGIGAAVALMAAAIKTNMDRVKEIWDRVTGSVGDSIKRIRESLSRLSGDTSGSVGIMKKSWQDFADVVTFIVDVVATAVEWLAQAIATTVEVIAGLISWLSAAWNRDLKGMDDAARQIFGSMANFMITTLQKALDIVMASVGAVVRMFNKNWANAIDGAREKLSEFAEGLKFIQKENEKTGKGITDLVGDFGTLRKSIDLTNEKLSDDSGTKSQQEQTLRRIELIETETEAKQIADEIDMDLSDKMKQRQQELTEHGIQMSEDKADAEESAQERIAQSLEMAADASFRSASAQEDAASAVKSAATDSIRAYISKGIAATIAGTLERFSITGPLAIGIAATAGAAAGALFSSAIPKLAGGGLLTGETMFIGGEYPGASTNPEVVAPLDRLRGMMEGGSNQSSMPREIRVVLDGDDAVGLIHRSARTKKRKGL